jgi:hypothetical protein
MWYIGPDAQSTRHIRVVGDPQTSINLQLFASELRLRGDVDIVQPHCTDRVDSDVLCWNGEVSDEFEIASRLLRES